ncbi:MAG: YkgJ family cysteine cluster protein [Thermoplasmata archaeon]
MRSRGPPVPHRTELLGGGKGRVGPPGPTERPVPEIDVALLSGFGFSCRPDCGLCCFASPRLDRDDETRLRAAAPKARVVLEGGERCVAARPDGGACQFLDHLRCAVHAARPAPCREFPVSVHIGTRLQATVVLSCPGLPLEPLLSYSELGATVRPSDLDAELSAVRGRLTPAVERRRSESERRRRRIARELEEQGRWVAEEEVRQQLRVRHLIPAGDEYFPDEPPAVEEGLERLPMYYDGRAGPVVLAQGLGGWEAHELFPEGGSRPVGIAVPPDQPPTLDHDADAMLSGYLRYWLARDSFLAAVHLGMLSTRAGTVVDAALDDLHAIGSDVLARGAVRAKLRGNVGARLSRADIEAGIRGTDQDWLDRPTWGSRL